MDMPACTLQHVTKWYAGMHAKRSHTILFLTGYTSSGGTMSYFP